MRLRPSILAAVLVLGLAVRLAGIDWGLPHLFEEATPLQRAWAMAGWGNEPADLNPGFFHYPSLTFYAHLGAQKLLHAAMRVAGAVESTREFRIRFHTDPTPHAVAARVMSVFFALLTMAALAVLPRRARPPSTAGEGVDARWVGPAATFLLAVNVYHISRSRMIEVDVPLTALATVALVAVARVAAVPTRRRYLLAGIAVGLAASAKYTGALLVVPLAAAHLMARRTRPGDASWPRLAAAMAAAGAAFAVTSPFVLLDFASFRADLALERTHMQLGHFGAGNEAAALFYLRRLGGALVGWPVLAFAAVGTIAAAVVRHRPWAVVSAVFAGVYAATISSWTMSADRYALPLLPPLLVLAAAGAAEVAARLPGRARLLAAGAAVTLLAVPDPAQLQLLRAQTATDSRSVALEWIERNLEPGSLVVTEAYGPPLFGPLDFWEIAADIRAEVYRRRAGGGFRGVLPIPLFQSHPEETAPYYDLDLYRGADVVITTGAVRGRYQARPEHFPAQNAFYHELEAGAGFDLVHTTGARGVGPRIFVYRNLRHPRPFASRPAGHPPQLDGGSLPPRWRAWFCYRQGLNYEAFGHLAAALESYQRGWPDTAGDSETFRQISYGIIRVLRLMDRDAEIPGFAARMSAAAPTGADRAFLERILAALSQ